MDPSESSRLVHTTKVLVSINTFYGIIWMCFTICATAFAVRLYIRYMCFRKLLIDDYLMVLALGLLFALSTMCQVFLVDIYEFIAVSNNSKIPGPDFLNVMSRGMRGFGTAMLLANIGIYTIKLSFLLFFRRLGAQIMSYQIFWWSVLVFTIGCLAVALRVMQYDCMFGNVTHIIGVCATHDTVRKTYTFFKLSCILDVVSDAFIVCFPVAILWRIRITLRKKILLSCVFGLVIFTIAVTIVRGSIFGGSYKSIDKTKVKHMNITWIWFWFFVEFTVSFIIACIVSFRALFAQRESRANASDARHRDQAFQVEKNQSPPKPSTFVARARQLHSSLLETMRSLETTQGNEDTILPVQDPRRVSLTSIRDEEAAYRHPSSDASIMEKVHVEVPK